MCVLAKTFVMQKKYLHEILEKSDELLIKQSALLLLAHLNDKSFNKKFSTNYSKQLACPNLLEQALDTSDAMWALASEALSIYGKIPACKQEITSTKHAFLRGLFEVVHDGKNSSKFNLTEFDKKILQNLSQTKNLSKNQVKDLFKEAFFQEADRFIRSNFIISLIDKKPIDYFGYDKAVLEFAIKALF